MQSVMKDLAQTIDIFHHYQIKKNDDAAFEKVEVSGEKTDQSSVL